MLYTRGLVLADNLSPRKFYVHDTLPFKAISKQFCRHFCEHIVWCISSAQPVCYIVDLTSVVAESGEIKSKSSQLKSESESC